MKPADVSDKDWEEALFTGIPANKKTTTRLKNLYTYSYKEISVLVISFY